MYGSLNCGDRANRLVRIAHDWIAPLRSLQTENITDPRPGERFIAGQCAIHDICAVIAGADDYVSIAKFANTKKDWFGKFLICPLAFLRTIA